MGSYVEIYYAGGERIDNIDSYREYFFSFTPPISNLCHLCINEERSLYPRGNLLPLTLPASGFSDYLGNIV